MHKDSDHLPEWINRGKTVRQLIDELLSFENQDLPIFISVDDGETAVPISLVLKVHEVCTLVYSGKSIKH